MTYIPISKVTILTTDNTLVYGQSYILWHKFFIAFIPLRNFIFNLNTLLLVFSSVVKHSLQKQFQLIHSKFL